MQNDFNYRVLDNLEKQLDQRLDKLWKVFNWTSSILLAIIGAIFIALKKRG